MIAKNLGLAFVPLCFFLATSIISFGPSPNVTDIGMQKTWAAKRAKKGPVQQPKKRKGPFVIVSGEVTNSLSGDPVAGAKVTFALVGAKYSTVTDADGMYSERLRVDPNSPGAQQYTATYEAGDYKTYSQDVIVSKGGPKTVIVNVALQPVAPVIVKASISNNAAPGSVLGAMGSWKIMDGSSLVGVEWTQDEGVAAAISSPMQANTNVTLPGSGAFKAELILLLKEPPITVDQLPPNVEPPEGEFVGGLQDRYQVVGINHFALERAGHIPLMFSVTTTSGIYSAMVDVHAALEWRVNPGLRTVPINIPVLLHGKDQASYDWTVMSAPAGSGVAALIDATGQNPEFTPDVPGIYEVKENVSAQTLKIHAGTWRGVIVGQDTNGRPISDPACTSCHTSGGFAPDKFTPWANTGHAEIFTNNLNTSDHYGTSCFGCHTVGYDLEANNGGFDEASDYQDFLASGLLASMTGTEWTQMLALFPNSAQLSNAQCENCHGPQNGPLGSYNTSHGGGVLQPDEARVSLSADVCGSCHGEPLRHARFQQWQLSRHSNYELAIDEGDSGSCSRCHTVNGFLTWLPVLKGDVPGDPLDDITVTWTADETHPQTCVTCHDPHNAGTTSGDNTNAPVRVQGDTPLLIAGFQAFGVGKGAMCMTCHNTRRGLRNDSTWATTTDKDRGPHGGVQADLLMGQNAYFVPVGNRGVHSFISDTCVNCHMKKTPPPADLAYNAGGSNHTFFAEKGVCIECHTGGEPNTAGVQAAVGGPLNALEASIADYYKGLISDLIAAGNQIDLDGDAVITNPAQILAIHISESRGRQAFAFDLASGTLGPYVLSAIDVIVGPNAGTTLIDHTDDTVLKAGWNYLLVHTDRSGGVHNPAFSSQVLEAAIAAINALP
jgi:hypothetical protein